MKSSIFATQKRDAEVNFRDNNIQGLSSEQVEEQRRQYGENVLTPPRRASMWSLYLEKYRDPIIQILLVAAGISLVFAFVEGQFVETIGIIMAIVFATTIGFYFECDAAKKFNVLMSLDEEQKVKVRRDGRVMEIARREVVVGDVVLVEAGDEVPADGELFVSRDLQVDESSLTGEPITEKGGMTDDGSSTYSRNLLLRSSMVMTGLAEYRVTAVGDQTEIGRVARKSTEITSVKTPLSMQLSRLATLISKIGTGVSILAFVLFLGHDIISHPEVWTAGDWMAMALVVLKYFMMAVTLIVMAVPEGLPMAVTLALALNMRRMLKTNNLVRKLHACETMGAVTVICTDKTGTLTQNRMQVFAISGDNLQHRSGMEMFYEAIAVNSTAELDGTKGIGNPTEAALLLWLKEKGCDYQKIRSEAKLTERQPFSTERKFMATRTAEHLFVKGAPEIVFALCETTAEERRQAEEELLGWQQRGMRTLAFACDGHLQAICAISDPLRDDVPDAVAQCKAAGIEVKIITGDTSATAIEIGRQIGIGTTDDDAYITGSEWAALTDEEALRRCRSIKIMSRARPSDKQRLVEMLQREGEVVAVTGDGTNDAPALHYAHVGLSLGSGTNVAKEASDMTLLDDSFASIANAVMWGRSLYKNIRRFLFFQLVVNLTALLLVLGGSLIGTEMPLTVTQILWVNLIMDTFAAMALASLPPSPEVMREHPRSQDEAIISQSMWQGILFCGIAFAVLMLVGLYYCEHHLGTGVDVHELTLFFTAFVMLQFWNLFNAKTLGTSQSAFARLRDCRGMLLVLLMILAGQWLIVEFGGKMFRTDGMSLREWLVIIGATSVVLWAGEFYRAVKRPKG